MTAETVYYDICSDNLDIIDICSNISNDESIKTISTTDTQPINEDLQKKIEEEEKRRKNAIYHKEYYHKKRKELIHCEHCGSIFTKAKIYTHKRSAKCINAQKNKNVETTNKETLNIHET